MGQMNYPEHGYVGSNCLILDMFSDISWLGKKIWCMPLSWWYTSDGVTFLYNKCHAKPDQRPFAEWMFVSWSCHSHETILKTSLSKHALFSVGFKSLVSKVTGLFIRAGSHWWTYCLQICLFPFESIKIFGQGHCSLKREMSLECLKPATWQFQTLICSAFVMWTGDRFILIYPPLVILQISVLTVCKTEISHQCNGDWHLVNIFSAGT